MTYSDTIKLAHELGAKYEVGYWKFPDEAAKATFRRRVSGLEWSPEQRAAMDKAVSPEDLLHGGKWASACCEHVLPLPDGAVMEDLQGNFYDEQGEKV